MAEHNHLTRDIKPLWSGCHGCDEYHVNALQMRIAALLAERDAARAEADKWQTIATAAQMARDDLKAEVAELKRDMQDDNEVTAQVMEELRQKSAEVAALEQAWDTGIKAVEYRVLADLRAKVEGLRDEAKADPVGSAVWRTTAYESVLALIEEVPNA